MHKPKDKPVISKEMKHVFGVLKEAGLPGVNPHKHKQMTTLWYNDVDIFDADRCIMRQSHKMKGILGNGMFLIIFFSTLNLTPTAMGKLSLFCN